MSPDPWHPCSLPSSIFVLTPPALMITSLLSAPPSNSPFGDRLSPCCPALHTFSTQTPMASADPQAVPSANPSVFPRLSTHTCAGWLHPPGSGPAGCGCRATGSGASTCLHSLIISNICHPEACLVSSGPGEAVSHRLIWRCHKRLPALLIPAGPRAQGTEGRGGLQGRAPPRA